MSWAAKRRFLIVTGIVLFFSVVIGVPIFFTFYEAPTCSDGKMNQGESGTDCGGPCPRLCSAETVSPLVLWARPFEIVPGVYSVVAYVENLNLDAQVEYAPYVFRLVDSKNVLVAERTGWTPISPNGVTPVFEGGIETGERKVARAFFEFTGDPFVWKTVEEDLPRQLLVRNPQLFSAASAPKVTAKLENVSSVTIEEIEVVAALFDTQDNLVSASQTYVEKIAKRESVDVVFTWPYPFTTQVTRIEIIPKIIPR
jgi:hypothetical protein